MDESGAEQDIYAITRNPDIVQTIPGMSYWRKSPDTVAIDLKRQDPARYRHFPSKLIKGKYGWNQISSPYIYLSSGRGSTSGVEMNKPDQGLRTGRQRSGTVERALLVRRIRSGRCGSDKYARVQQRPAEQQSSFSANPNGNKIKLTTGKGMDAEKPH